MWYTELCQREEVRKSISEKIVDPKTCASKQEVTGSKLEIDCINEAHDSRLQPKEGFL